MKYFKINAAAPAGEHKPVHPVPVSVEQTPVKPPAKPWMDERLIDGLFKRVQSEMADNSVLDRQEMLTRSRIAGEWQRQNAPSPHGKTEG